LNTATNRFFDRPILNSPYEAPRRHWELDNTGQPTNRIVDGRRRASLVAPVPRSRKAKGAKQQREIAFHEYNPIPIINEVRRYVAAWRNLAPHQWQVTPETARLLSHWRHHPFANQRPFFCHIEAVETAIWLTEVAPKARRRTASILNHLKGANERDDPTHGDLPRLALKLATGAGKTTVMAMLIAWQTINAVRRPNSRLFTRGFLVVAPGITIRDRLRVLLPNDPDSYYAKHELVPFDLLADLGRAEIVVTNYHVFQRRETQALPKGSRAFLHGNRTPPDTRETSAQMLQRVCAQLLGMKHLVVFNDEAHHCYREKPSDPEEGALKGDELVAKKENQQAARLWISGIESLTRRVRVSRVFDLSATPFFLTGSGYAEGTLFPWTMSDFSLLDAIECGIVKLPRVPVADNIPTADAPVYRNLWQHIGRQMPKGRRIKGTVHDPSQLPVQLQTALDALYGHYEKTFTQWQAAGIDAPPCFIVVCNNTKSSKLLYDYISGYQRPAADGQQTLRPGALPLFRNFTADGQSLPQPRTLLIDSRQIESGEALNKGFRAAAADESERFKRERVERSGNPADRDNICDEDLLREVMNTVGKPGRLGESIRCVVSVAMLTEGWDANNVTHILGVRAFGTQLLCEQVVGRALRRQSYQLNADGRFDVEYADVLGIPFDFTAKPQVVAPPKPTSTVIVQAVSPERDGLEIRFPRVAGYRVELADQRLGATFDANSTLVLTPELVGPTRTRNEGLIGRGVDLSPDKPGANRRATLIYCLARHLIERHWQDDNDKAARFAELQRIVARWLEEHLDCTGGTKPGQLAYRPLAAMACDKITQAIISHLRNLPPTPVLDPGMPEGSTKGVRFTTTRSKTLWRTDPRKCHLDHAVCDSEWEAEFCRIVEAHPRTLAYVKNHRLGFEVPYCFGGVEHRYVPDFIVRLWEPQQWRDPMHLVVEIKGRRGEQDKAKAAAMTARWIPAVNSKESLGRWAFAKLTDVHSMEADYRAVVQGLVLPWPDDFKEWLRCAPINGLDLARDKSLPREIAW